MSYVRCFVSGLIEVASVGIVTVIVIDVFIWTRYVIEISGFLIVEVEGTLSGN